MRRPGAAERDNMLGEGLGRAWGGFRVDEDGVLELRLCQDGEEVAEVGPGFWKGTGFNKIWLSRTHVRAKLMSATAQDTFNPANKCYRAVRKVYIFPPKFYQQA